MNEERTPSDRTFRTPPYVGLEMPSRNERRSSNALVRLIPQQAQHPASPLASQASRRRDNGQLAGQDHVDIIVHHANAARATARPLFVRVSLGQHEEPR